MLNEIGASFPVEIFNHILEHVQGKDLIANACVNKQFETLTNLYANNNLPKGVFGKASWLKYKGDPGDVPNLPLKMYVKFDPAVNMLTLIPEGLNKVPLDLASFDKFVSDYKNGKEAFESNYVHPLVNIKVNDIAGKAHWVLLNRNLTEETRNKEFPIVQEMVKNKGYEMIHLIDAVVSTLMNNLEESPIYDPYSRSSYLLVKETDDEGDAIIVTMGNTKFVIDVVDPGFSNDTIGAAFSLSSKNDG